MNAQILIDSTVRQVTVLIAQLATSGGIRAPLAQVANQVFVELANELEAQGVSRKVSADMFGMALRAYIRKVRRLTEDQTEGGKTLWQAVFEFVQEQGLVSRVRVHQRFANDGELEVSSIIKDLSDSGLIFSTGRGATTAYRAANEVERNQHFLLADRGGLEEMAWVLVFREGPLAVSELGTHMKRSEAELQELVNDLCRSGRVHRKGEILTAKEFVIPLGAPHGWEASVFDHIQAVVQTICQRLRSLGDDESGCAEVGGSTYSFDVWHGHPLEQEVKELLASQRSRLGDLRSRVEAHNEHAKRPQSWTQVTAYAGQCVLLQIEEEDGDYHAS